MSERKNCKQCPFENTGAFVNRIRVSIDHIRSLSEITDPDKRFPRNYSRESSCFGDPSEFFGIIENPTHDYFFDEESRP